MTQRHTMFLDQETQHNNVNFSQIYWFNETPIKILARDFIDIVKITLNFMWKSKGAGTILKKNKMG